MIIIGVNAYHGDSSACIIKNGELIAAAEEERFRRIKHWAGFPSEAIRYCLREADVRLGDVDFLAVNRYPKANIWRKAGYILRKKPDFGMLKERFRNMKKISGIRDELEHLDKNDKFRGKIRFIEHHTAHLASTFLVSPFDRALAVSVDGFGDFASCSWGLGEGSHLKVDDRIYFPHSLGIFYQAMTQYLGFPKYGDEYKVMGLAPYGKPEFTEELGEVLKLEDNGKFRLNLKYFRHHKDSLDYEWGGCAPRVGRLYSGALESLLGKAREGDEQVRQKHMDIARSVQVMYEKAFYHLLNSLYKKYRTDTLALSGGCAMNSVANGKIHKNTPFRKVYVQPAAGDAGGAIGAAYQVWYEGNNKPRTFKMDHAGWGPSYTNDYIGKLLDSKNKKLGREKFLISRIFDEDQLCRRTAMEIADGKVIGWFQGRMEWGPRALGNRSILCDPRRPDMKDILNMKIKRRESFRPFAPSIHRDAVSDWFETDDDVPFMMKVFQIRSDRRDQIPAVTHVDGSGRLQTVSKENNPLYYNLINKFSDLTGVPIILNTSFNENEPVVCRPEEALNCFLRTKMDVLVMGNYVITRMKTPKAVYGAKRKKPARVRELSKQRED